MSKKAMNWLEKANKVAKILVASYGTIFVFIILTIVALIVFMSETTTKIDYNVLLKEVGNVNITVAIGLGALAVAISKQFLQTDFIRIALVILTLGILNFVLSYTSIDTQTLKAWFWISVFFNLLCIISFTAELATISKEQDKEKKASNNTSKNINI